MAEDVVDATASSSSSSTPARISATAMRLRKSLALLPKAAAESLRGVKVNRDSTGQVALFLLKVGALEIVRRGALQRCPHLWWALQGIPILHSPPLAFLQRWAPFRFLMRGTQVFSKPVFFLSIATAFTSAMDHSSRHGKGTNQDNATDNLRSADDADAEAAASAAAAAAAEEESHRTPEDELSSLRRDLDKHGISVPERLNEDELERFYAAANRNSRKFVGLVKKNLRWRENFRFLSDDELKEWSQLVYWHHSDSVGRPLLIIRLGVASSTLASAQRPRFVQAIVSQIEYGVLNLLNPLDPRLTVVLDCSGAPSVGFPLHMTKSCCALVQENYPTRLAALFIVNLPPLVRVVANAIVQILKPATREKIFVHSEDSERALAQYLGDMDRVPVYLGGTCKCSLCNLARSTTLEGHREQQLLGGIDDDSDQAGFLDSTTEVSPYQACSGVLRVAIVSLLVLWIMIALLAGFYNPDLDGFPT